MTRRFWVGAILSLPVLLVAMSDMLPGQPLHQIFFAALARLVSIHPVDAGGVLVRLAVFRARLGVHRQSQPQHVHLDRHRRRHGVSVQRRGDVLSRHVSGFVSRPRRRGRRLFRGRGGHHDSGAARPGAGTARAQQHQRRHPGAARPGAENRAPCRCGRQRERTCPSIR